jgi:hypothetical protein
MDIPVVSAGGVANSAAQDAFCARTSCVISRIYDQTALGNHLTVAPQHVGHNGTDRMVNATRDRLRVGGAPVYSAFFEGGMGYRNDATNGIPLGDDAQTIYMVTSGVHFNNRCCFDYVRLRNILRAPCSACRRHLTPPQPKTLPQGNAEKTPRDDGAGTMECVTSTPRARAAAPTSGMSYPSRAQGPTHHLRAMFSQLSLPRHHRHQSSFAGRCISAPRRVG